MHWSGIGRHLLLWAKNGASNINMKLDVIWSKTLNWIRSATKKVECLTKMPFCRPNVWNILILAIMRFLAKKAKLFDICGPNITQKLPNYTSRFNGCQNNIMLNRWSASNSLWTWTPHAVPKISWFDFKASNTLRGQTKIVFVFKFFFASVE